MATTIRIPIDIHAMDTNGTWVVNALTAYRDGHYEWIKDVAGHLYGRVPIPKNVNATPNAKVVLAIKANATSGVTRMSVSGETPADGQSMNPASFQGSSTGSVDITVPSTARLRKDQSFTLPTSGGNFPVAADDILILDLYHEGAHANDTLAVNTELVEAMLEIDVN